MIVNEVLFEVEEEDEDPKPLRMEHFYFPLGTSVFWLRSVGVAQSNTELEDGHNSDVGDIEDTEV